MGLRHGDFRFGNVISTAPLELNLPMKTNAGKRHTNASTKRIGGRREQSYASSVARLRLQSHWDAVFWELTE